MKKTILMMTALLVIATGALAGDTEWFDMANCTMCKHMAADPGFMENVQWENHVLENGWMMVTVVPESYKEGYDAVVTKMQAEGMKLMGGAEGHLCNFCSNMMGIMGTGKVVQQEFETIGGKVTLMTSDDPEVAMKLKKHAKKTIKEFEKMMMSEEASR